MLYLLACIICSTLLNIIFKLFTKYRIENYPAIVINYFVCATIGFTYLAIKGQYFYDVIGTPWFGFALVLSSAFIIGFTIIAKTVQQFGIGITTIAQKMSMVITVLVAIFFYAESVNWMRIVGIALAIFSIILISMPEKQISSKSEKLWILPILAFSLNGIIETGLYVVEKSGRTGQDELLFTATLFLCAGFWGLLKMIFDLQKKKYKLKSKELVAGLVLGIPNLGSIVFLLLALNSGLDGAVVFPFNSVAILILSVVLGFLIFREKIARDKWFGFAMAVISILFLAI